MESIEQRRKRNQERAARMRQRRNEKHLASIAKSLSTISAAVEDEEGWLVKAILLHATVMKNDVARALNNNAVRPRGRKS